MELSMANKRPKYLDNEISKLFNLKRIELGLSIKTIANNYNVSIKTIEYMDKYQGDFSIQMLEIAADFLNKDINEFLEILEDDNCVSTRGNLDEESKIVYEIANMLFDKIIMQQKLSI